MKRIMLFLVTMLTAFSLWASPISDAVDAGKVKELPSGYVEAVDKSAEIAELVKKVNTGRKAEYERIAKETGVTADVVGKASYEKRFGNKK